ncbi:conserved hypothetical protein [Vibrio crassostreae]|jgi:hypothetical protein|uniref:hypothetical protein n=1 Tax=Vibrio TaxID=662 RepID=UPI0003603EF9|nr:MULTISPECIES: hypothetical protein [Vibrio]TCN91628.1 hypothetical protein EDB50_11717 [Vibrio crassostreae]MCG9564602.1 hypothetical protein [Vibrio chagasii]MCY9829401.1 hypothetical protein [Vibrio chagasii]CAH6784028.1 conserved hypothetical protein [Vibrio chagasii]CAH6919250.1 conserved hypothetical protein [Vibrio chagasii]
MDTLICRSFQSFIDFCDNEIVEGKNVHCTFKACKDNDWRWMKIYLEDKGGKNLTFSFI